MNKAKSPKSIRFYMDSGKWGFLSPMYLCPITIGGTQYKSAEHYYQSTKARSEDKRRWITDSATGYQAKDRAHMLAPNETVKKSPEEKVATMREAFVAKFTQNQELGMALLETGNVPLLEDSPDDLFWGAKGENWIGKLAMEAREAVKRQKLEIQD